MTYEDCADVIRQFRFAYPAVASSSNVHGLQVTYEEGTFVLELVVYRKVGPDKLLPDEIMPAEFEYKVQDEKRSIPTRVTAKPIAEAHTATASANVTCGSTASYSAAPLGTAGWNVYFQTQNIWVCVSNWHVLVNPLNPNPYNSVIYLNGSPVAQLHAFTISEEWDYAIARFTNPLDASAAMRPCIDGTQYPYPQRLADDISFERYFKVGARSPICRTGELKSVGDRHVKYATGQVIHFRNQLIFSKMSDGGDSGAVIVRERDLGVTGLNFAGNDSETIANPLYKIGWKYRGTITLEGGGGAIPIYESLEPRTARASTLDHLATFEASVAQGVAEGRFYLGIAVRRVNFAGTRWETAVPPQIRPVTVQTVHFKHEALETMEGTEIDFRDYYPCFG